MNWVLVIIAVYWHTTDGARDGYRIAHDYPVVWGGYKSEEDCEQWAKVFRVEEKHASILVTCHSLENSPAYDKRNAK